VLDQSVVFDQLKVGAVLGARRSFRDRLSPSAQLRLKGMGGRHRSDLAEVIPVSDPNSSV
jgi:hypothetical protein